MKNNRNKTIDFLKLALSIIVLIYHITINIDGMNLFPRGLLAVDFFFIVSGYLFYNSVIKKDDKEESIYKQNISFIWKKLKLFYPLVFVGTLECLIARIIIDNIKIHTILNSIFTFSLVHMSGLPLSKINNVTWYISVMLMTMFIMFPIIKKNKDKYINYICPIILILGFGLFNKYFHNFNELLDYNFVYNGFLRGFLEINLGCLACHISSWIKNKEFTKLAKILATITEVLGYIFFGLMMCTTNEKIDLFLVLVITVAIIISFSKLSYTEHIFSKLSFKNMDKLSLSIYCNHIFIITILIFYNTQLKLSSIELTILILVISIIYSYLVMIFVDKSMKKKYFNKLKNLLIK